MAKQIFIPSTIYHDEYFACLSRSNASAATSFNIKEYYPRLYQSMHYAKDLIEKRGFLTSNIHIARNILCSVAFDIFKKMIVIHITI